MAAEDHRRHFGLCPAPRKKSLDRASVPVHLWAEWRREDAKHPDLGGIGGEDPVKN